MNRTETNLQKDFDPLLLKNSISVTERILLIKKLRAAMLRVEEHLAKTSFRNSTINH
jgi:hypothetical protein